MDSISKHILQLENSLLINEVRKLPQRISELLLPDFIEFTSSGREYHYKNGDVFQEQNNNDILNWEIVDFKTKELATDRILAMYKLVKHSELNECKKYSLRSSVWKFCEGKWSIVFHQGTPISQ